MANIKIFDRTGNAVDHSRIPVCVANINLRGSVQEFRKKIFEVIDVANESVDLVYCGQYLRDGKNLENYGLKSGSVVYILPKVIVPDMSAVAGNGIRSGLESLAAIRSATLNPSYRQIVERMLIDPEVINNLTAAVPGIDKDPSVLSIIQDPVLVAMLIQPQCRERLNELHPSFMELAVTVATAVNEETIKEGNRITLGSYSLDQMSDDDDDEPEPSNRLFQGAVGGQPITASQLAAALEAATAASQPSGSGQPEQSTSGTSFITSDFFQQAMMQAQTAAQPSNPAVTQSQLQQLREMGITDENRARRALQLSNGDIHAALELIFSDSSF